MEEKSVKSAEKEHKAVYLYLLRLFSKRDYTVLELQKKCKDKGFSPEAIVHGLGLMAPYLDDERVAKAHIRDLIRKGKGERAIYQKLRAITHFSQEEIFKWISEASPKEDQMAIIQKLMLKKLKGKDGPKERTKAIRSLLGRGFPPSVVFEAIKTQHVWGSEEKESHPEYCPFL